MSFTTVTVTETFFPDDPGGVIPSGYATFELNERMHDGSGNEVEPELIAAPLSHVYTITQSGASAGTVIYNWNGLSTSAVAYNATASTVLAALQALSGFPAGATASGGALGTNPVVITVPGDTSTITATPTLTGGTLTVAAAASLSQALYANDDTTTVPVGTFYTVNFDITAVGQRPPVEITVPHTAASGTCTLASLS